MESIEKIEERVEKALHYLANTDEKAAKAKALLIGLEGRTKTIEAVEYLKSSGLELTIPERTARVHSSQPYIEHQEKIKNAVYDFELLKNRRHTADTIFEFWRSYSVNRRQGV